MRVEHVPLSFGPVKAPPRMGAMMQLPRGPRPVETESPPVMLSW